jgi:hypothetical protein
MTTLNFNPPSKKKLAQSIPRYIDDWDNTSINPLSFRQRCFTLSFIVTFYVMLSLNVCSLKSIL